MNISILHAFGIKPPTRYAGEPVKVWLVVGPCLHAQTLCDGKNLRFVILI